MEKYTQLPYDLQIYLLTECSQLPRAVFEKVLHFDNMYLLCSITSTKANSFWTCICFIVPVSQIRYSISAPTSKSSI